MGKREQSIKQNSSGNEGYKFKSTMDRFSLKKKSRALSSSETKFYKEGISEYTDVFEG